MPKNNDSTFGRSLTKNQASQMNRGNRRISGNINALLDSINMSTYGINRRDKVDSLMDDFNKMLSNEVDNISKTADGDTTSFITKLFSDNNKKIAASAKDIEDAFSTNDGQIQSFLVEQYKNRLLMQNDLHDIASQLIELQQAITITRDAIISADIVDGHMSRTITFDVEDDGRDYIPIVENMEIKFKMQSQIKNFIIPKTLEFGEYHRYCIPYSKLFEDFAKEKDYMNNGKYRSYSESKEFTLFEYVNNTKQQNNIKDIVIESVSEIKKKNSKPLDKIISTSEKTEIQNELNEYLKNITICNEPIPIPILEEGVESSREYFTEFYEDIITEDSDSVSFANIMKGVENIDAGVHSIIGSSKKKNRNTKGDFSNIKDCYVKLIDPMHILPIRIMDEVIGYYYIQDEEINPMAGILTSTIYYDNIENRNENNILSTIAETIVSAFDKKFLKDNIKFKKLIVEALNYYKLNNRKVKFQFIPKEYIRTFKINEDEHGNGTSIIEPSLFYAKLYLMLLLFKMMSIVLNSNDTKVNYIKSSGIETNVSNKIQEIARKKQQRQINLTDMFSYTTLVNKIGQGSEMYIPVGKSDRRGIETEILSGQDVQMNTDLMEMLKKAYISATGVPDVLMNYFNEADFAKTLELANNRFQGSVVSYQLDFNEQITEMYKDMMRHTTIIPEDVIETFQFNFIQPKSSNSNITNDLLNNHNSLQDFLTILFFGDTSGDDNPETTEKMKKWKMLLAKDRLPMLDFDNLQNLYDKACMDGAGEALKPSDKSNDEV